jgi:hypothetical protein
MTTTPPALERSLVDLPLGGMEEKVGPRQGTVPDLVSNLRQWETGELRKRWGSTCLGRFNARLGGGTPPAAEVLAPYGEGGTGLARVGSMQLDSYELRSATDWVYRGRVGVGKITTTCALAVNYAYVFADAAVSPDYAWTVLARSDQIVQIVDNATGNTRAVAYAGTSAWVKVAFASNGVAIVVGDTGGFGVKAWAVTCATGAVSAGTVIAASGINSRAGAITRSSQASEVLVAFPDAAGNTITIARVDATATVTQSTTFVSTTASSCAVSESGGTLFVAWSDTTAWRYLARSATNVTSVILAATSIVGALSAQFTGIVAASSTQALATAFDVGGSGGVRWAHVDTSGVVGTVRQIAQAAQVTNPWTYGGRFYVAIGVDTPPAGYGWKNGVLLDLGISTDSGTNTATVAGSFMYGALRIFSSGFFGTEAAGLLSVTPISATKVRFAANVINSAIAILAAENQWRYVDVEHVAPRYAVTARNMLVCSGGVPFCFDGIQTSELGMVRPVVTASGSAGGTMTTYATYKVVAVYEWTDAQGARHASPPSSPVSVTLAAGQGTVSITVRYDTITSRDASTYKGTQVAIYATQANSTTYYFVKSTPNDRTTATFSTSITSEPLATRLLYTTGSILEYVMPPSAGHVAVIGLRTWLSDTDDGTVWFSGQQLAGEPPRFNPQLTIAPFGTGRVVACSGMDEKIILWKADAIYMTYGTGPSDVSTDTATFPSPQVVSSEVGCVDPRSIVVTTLGTFFQSRSGLCLLTRSLEVVRVGQQVRTSAGTELATPYTITGAVSVPQLTEVRFAVQAPNEQRALVFDLYHGGAERPVWYRYSWTDPAGGTPQIAAACLWNGRFTWINTSGRLYQDDPSSYLDACTGYTSAWVTADVTFNDWRQQGSTQSFTSFFSVGLVGDYLTAHDLTVQLFADYASAATQTVTFTNATLSALDREALIVQVADQKHTAMRVRVVDATPSSGVVGTGQGMRLGGVSLEVGPRGGLLPRPATAKS